MELFSPPERVLIVDDQPANVRLLERLLHQEGYQDVHGVTDPRQALEAFRTRAPDLVLLDLMMKPIGGMEILQGIRRAVAPEVYLPVLVLTADVTMESRRAALAAGATDFLTKPLDNLEVVLRIRNLLKTRALYLQLQRHSQNLEEAVRERTRELSERGRMMDLASDAFLVRDLEGKLLYWNKGAERIYGYSADEVLGGDIRQRLGRSPAAEETAMRAVREQGEWSGEFRHRRKDGKEVLVQARLCLVRDEQGQPWATFCVHTDVTDARAIEQQLQRVQRLESLGALAGGVAHDLNNMLTPITMGLGVVRNCVQDVTGLEMLNTMALAAESGRGLVKQLLTFVRGAPGQQRRELLPTPYLKEVTALLARSLPAAIALDVQIARDLWAIRMDVTHLYQIVMNLAINARDAMKSGGTLTIAVCNKVVDEAYARIHGGLARAGQFIVLSVTDTGTGIPPELVERIFEPFFTTKDAEQGTGLGLATTAQIVASHAGFIRVTSQVGQGSRFEVFLPAVEAVGEFAVAEALPPGGNGELILVADDEAAIREIIRTTLESANYRVLTAGDGAEAVAAVAQHREAIRLVLTDWRMPAVDGAVAVRAMHKLRESLPIVLVSGSPPPENEAIPGVRRRLCKPFTANELLRVVHETLAGEA